MKRLSDIISPAFHEMYQKAFYDDDVTFIVESGGRNAGKSANIALTIVLKLMREPINAVAIRKTDNTLQNSVFQQILWAIDTLGVEKYFIVRKSPLSITYKPRGNYIIFRGAQDPSRLKSLTDARFPFALAWIEEMDEFNKEEDVMKIKDSIVREKLPKGCQYKIFYSYNPPKQKHHWINKRYHTQILPPRTYHHHSTYMDNPYCSDEMIAEAEGYKKDNHLLYEWAYLGLPVGSGVEPFPNLNIKKGNISQEMIDSFDNYRFGVDWGYSIDPLAFVVLHYDKKRRKIYFVDEFVRTSVSSKEFADYLRGKHYDQDIIIADAAEPRTIAEVKNVYNIPHIKGAKKGKDSVEFGTKWLSELNEIVIDPLLTPKTAKEFEQIDFETDRYGETLPRLEDKNNHCLTGDSVVITENGEELLKNIKESGKILSYNTNTNSFEFKPYFDKRVTRKNATIVEVQLESDRTVKMTPDHLVLTTKGWKEIQDCNEETEIISYEITTEKIKKITFLKEKEDVYNLEVEDNHNYVANNIVVHNCIDATRYALNDDMKPVKQEKIQLKGRL